MKNNNVRSETSSPNQIAENIIKEYKKKVGEVIRVSINSRTTIELPAHLSQEEREIRIELYKKLHKSKV